MSAHAASHFAYIAGAFGMALLAVAIELLWLARRRRRPRADLDDTP